MMPKYEKYKASGIEWLENIPEQWDLKRLKRVTRMEYGESLSNENRSEGDVPVFGSNGQVDNHNIAISKSPCIIIGRKGSYGKVIYSELACFPIDTTYYIDNRFSLHNLRWLYYLLDSIGLDKLSKDTGVPGLNREDAYSNFIVLPLMPEQLSISKYLDDKTAKLDKLIKNKKEQIEKLKEIRQIEINNAVTKGLNPNAKMKPSGIEWLGDIPEHWKVKKLKQVTYNIGDGIHTTPNYIDSTNYFFVNGNNLIDKTIQTSNVTNTVSEEEYEKYKINLKKGTLLISINGTIGNLSFYNNEKVIFGKSIAYIELYNSIEEKFIYYFLQSDNANTNFNISLAGTTISNLSLHTLRNTKVVIPTEVEQCQIAHYLDIRITHIDRLILNIEAQIEQLQEIRKIEIYNAVTGKIKVV